MLERVVRLETRLEDTIERVDRQLTSLAADVRELRGDGRTQLLVGIGCAFALLCAGVSGYVKLSDHGEKQAEQLSRIEVGIQKLTDTVAAIPKAPAASEASAEPAPVAKSQTRR